MLTYSTRLSYLPANRQGGTRTRDPVISCAFGAAVIRYKLQATCTNPYCPKRANCMSATKKLSQHNKNKR